MSFLKTNVLLFSIAGLCTASAQETYWGMTNRGGQSGAGTIYTVNTAGTFTKRYDFQANAGQAPRCEVIKATGGLYYGVTAYGGDDNLGVLFRIDPADNSYLPMRFFSAALGSYPEGGVVQAANGRLYGTCRTGGANGVGTIYEFNIATSVLTKRTDMTVANGSSPRGRLVEAGNGKLYGVTSAGGANALGSVFEFDPAANTFAKRADLSAATGSNPGGGLMLGADGLLYGTTEAGGANGLGTVFSFNTATFAVVKVVDLSAATGTNPKAALVQTADGALHGTASAGGANGLGTLFKVTLAPNTITKQHDMDAGTGATPLGKLTLGSDGLLYGLASAGGTGNHGTFYRFDPVAMSFSNLRNLGTVAANPWAGLLEEPAGTFIGTSNLGGSLGRGVVFRFSPGTNSYASIAQIGASSGAFPTGKLTRAANGLFYGFTSAGGTVDRGVLFSFDPVTSTYARLYNFGSAFNGQNPVGAPVIIGNVVYGACRLGGLNGFGVIFTYDIGTNTYTTRVNLNNTIGTLPQAGMTLAPNGRLYGTLTEGGTGGVGSVYEFDPATNTFTVRKHLAPVDGGAPKADMVVGSDGMLYGTVSEYGAYEGGSVFRFNTATNTYARVGDLEVEKGVSPRGELVEVTPGKFYGTTATSGTNQNGTIFSCNVGTGVVVNELNLTTAMGSASEAALIRGSDGLLYGTCAGGGNASGHGTVFRFNPTTPGITVVRTLAFADGIYPQDGLAKETIPAAGEVQLALKVLLGGPLNTTTGIMNDGLRGLPTFPLTEPYSGLGYTHVAGGGGETTTAAALAVTGNNAIVDWVFVELRSKTDPSVVLATRSALVQRDGDVVAGNGTSPLTFAVAPDDYRIAVHHRNHLATRTLNVVTLGASSTAVDLSTGALALFGTNPVQVSGSFRALWPGNVVPDASVRYLGGANDRDPILVRVGGAVPTGTATGYHIEDVTLDGQVKYTGAGNDRDPVLTTIGGSIPTAVRTEQL